MFSGGGCLGLVRYLKIEMKHMQSGDIFNPIALRKAKIVCNFGLSECNRVKQLH